MGLGSIGGAEHPTALISDYGTAYVFYLVNYEVLHALSH